MVLALRLGRTLGELMDTIDTHEVSLWREWDRTSPLGDDRADVLLSELDECLGGGRDSAEGLEAEDLVREINEYLAGTDRLSRILFVRRYFFLDELPELAAGSGLSVRAVTGRLYRLRQGLKEHLIKKGVIV